jgi:hypothetical protein
MNALSTFERKFIVSQNGDIRDYIDKFLSILETSEELEKNRVKLIDYINERCEVILEEAGFKSAGK